MGMMLGRLQMMKGAHGKRSYNIASSSKSYEATDPANAEVSWSISGASSGTQVSGYVQYDQRDAGDAATFTNHTQFTDPIDDWGVLYFRLTYDAASDTVLSTTHAIDGSTWHALTEDSNNIVWTTFHGSIAGDTTTIIDVEMATDAAGTNIVDTATYTSICTVVSGA